MSIRGLNKESSETIGFVLACLFNQAIDLSEVKEWCDQVACEYDAKDLPPYIFDLMDYEGTLVGIYKVIGFVPAWEPSREIDSALYGIALARGRRPYDMMVSTDEATSAFESDDQGVVSLFRKTFPFIGLERK